MGGRQKKKIWTTVMMLLLLGACPLHIFVGSLVDLPVLWRQPSLAASTHHPHYPSEEHTKPPPSVSALGGCSRSDADCSTGLIAISTPWVSISLCLWSPHSTSLPAWEFCADCARGEVGRPWVSGFLHPQLSCRQDLRVAMHAALTDSPQALLWPCQIQWLEKPL